MYAVYTRISELLVNVQETYYQCKTNLYIYGYIRASGTYLSTYKRPTINVKEIYIYAVYTRIWELLVNVQETYYPCK